MTQNQYQATVNQHDMEGNFRALASRSRPGGRSLADLGYTDAVRMHAAPRTVFSSVRMPLLVFPFALRLCPTSALRASAPRDT